MPLLPSGRSVGLDPTVLLELIKRAESGQSVPWFYRIHDREDLRAFIRLIYFIDPAQPTQTGKPVQYTLDRLGIPAPDGFQLVQSGFSVAQEDDATAAWPADDRRAFEAFLEEPRTLAYLDELLADVLRARDVMPPPDSLKGILD